MGACVGPRNGRRVTREGGCVSVPYVGMSAADHGPSWLPWRSAAAALDVDGWLVVVVVDSWGVGCRRAGGSPD